MKQRNHDAKNNYQLRKTFEPSKTETAALK